MSSFTFMAVMLTGVIVANIIKEFFSRLSVMFILIAVGVLLSFLPQFRYFQLEPKFFMMLIIAPLMFYEGSQISLKKVRAHFRGIFFLSITLAVTTIILVATLTNSFMGNWVFPLAICFAAIVTPTDAVAVKSILAGRKMPAGVNDAVEFESLFNDATGLVLLSLGLSVLERGHFSIWESIGKFTFVSAGGILIGLVFGALLVRIRTSINHRATNPEATIIPLSLLTPFLIYLLAEHFETSGVLAVVAAGLVHNLEGNLLKLTSTNVQLTNNTIWKILSELLNNFVFILLGMSLFGLRGIFQSLGFFSTLALLLISLVVYLFMFLIRKLWTNRRGNRSIRPFFSNDPAERRKDSTIFALAGAHGTITLAMAFSLPIDTAILSLENREVIIAIAALLILISLIIPSLFLPKLLGLPTSTDSQNLDLLRNEMVDYAILHLAQDIPESSVRSSLTKQLQSQKGLQLADHNQSQKLLNKIMDWQEEALESEAIRQHYSATVIAYFKKYLVTSQQPHLIKRIKILFRQSHHEIARSELIHLRADLERLEDQLYDQAVLKLYILEKERWDSQITDFSDIEEVKRILKNRHSRIHDNLLEDSPLTDELLIEAFQLEYQFILDKIKAESISKENGDKLLKEINRAQVLQLQRNNS